MPGKGKQRNKKKWLEGEEDQEEEEVENKDAQSRQHTNALLAEARRWWHRGAGMGFLFYKKKLV